jgi:polyhydroxybutyrate depolymerase
MPLVLFLLMAARADSLAPGDHRQTVTVDGMEREYFLHIPVAADKTKPAPVVLAFHGGGSNAQQMIAFCGMNEKADEAGFIVVYPNGAGRIDRARTWNAGNCCGYAQRQQIDDVKFVRLLLDDLRQSASVDEARVYATGMSNGAMLCYRLASEMSDRIAAIAPVAGPMGIETCNPSHAVPVCHFHGAEDQFAPFGGGRGARSLSRTDFHSVEHSIRQWIRANNCQQEAKAEELAATIEDGTHVTRTMYAGGRNGAEVVLYTIHGGGHTWPGRRPLLSYLGPSTRNLSANDVMWEFFRRFER